MLTCNMNMLINKIKFQDLNFKLFNAGELEILTGELKKDKAA